MMVTITPEISKLLREHDLEAIALETFNQLDYLKPISTPPLPPFIDPRGFEAWRKGAPMPEVHLQHYAQHLKLLTKRSADIAENERRLRSSTWAQWRLRGTDYEALFAEFHRHFWGLDEVRYDSAEREMQVQARARHGVV